MIPTLGTRALLIAFWQGVLASHQNILCLGDKLSDNQCSRQIGSLLTTAPHCCSVLFQIYCSRWRWLTLSSWLLCWLSWLRLRAKFYLIVTPQSPAFILTIFRETFIKMLILRIHNGDNILLWSPHSREAGGRWLTLEGASPRWKGGSWIRLNYLHNNNSWKQKNGITCCMLKFSCVQKLCDDKQSWIFVQQF